MTRIFANNATTLLETGISDSDLTLTVVTGTGQYFPELTGGDHMDLTLESSLGAIEIVRCTGHSSGSDTFTLSTRGVENTTAAAFTAGSRVELRLTAAALNGWFQDGDVIDGGSF